MPAAVFIQLSFEEDAELLRLCRLADLNPSTRARFEAARLSNAGWQAEQVASYLDISLKTVRRVFNRYRQGGLEALKPQPHPNRLKPTITEPLQAHLVALLEANQASPEPRTYSAPELAAELERAFGVKVHRETVRATLAKMGYRYKRTRYVPAGEPDPKDYEETVERLEVLKSRGESDERSR